MSIRFLWKGDNHWSNLSEAFDFLNSLGWPLSIEQRDNTFFLLGGEIVILSSDNQEEIQTFILGMALGLGVLPDDILKKIHELID